MDVAVNNIVYDDDHIRVIWHPGSSDFVLITFGDMISLADDERFYADVPVMKSGFACLGLMAKAPNWFPADSVYAACQATSGLLAPYRERVTYGGSMGGYGAVKFSRAFDATTVIAFCPQWSIDRKECGTVDPGWTEHFTPHMTGMGVRPEDTAGRIYLFLDSWEPTDNFHADKIQSIHPSTKRVEVPFCNHHVTSVLAGTKPLNDIIDHCRRDDVAPLAKVIAPLRRSHPKRNIVVLHRALTRLPRIGQALFIKHINDVDLQKHVSWSFSNILASSALNDDRAMIVDFLHAILPYAPSLRHKLNTLSMMSRLTGSDIFIASYFGSLILYDNALGYCRHVTQAEFRRSSFRYVPIKLRFTGRRMSLSADLNQVELDLYPDESYLVSGIGAPATRDAWDITFDDAGAMSLSYDKNFLSALPGGTLICSQPAAHEWEKFTFSLLPRPSSGQLTSA